MKHHFRIAIIVAAALTASAAADEFSYMFFDDSVPLGLDETRIALRADDSGIALEALAALGLDDLTVDRERAGWYEITLPPANRGVEAITVLTDALAADARVRAVSPVFRDDRDGPLIVRPQVFVRFTQGATGAGATLAAHGLVAMKTGYGGIDGLYRAVVATGNALETLDVANALARRADVEFAEPAMIMTGYPHELIPNDPGFDDCWGLHNTGQPVDGWNPVPDVDVNAPQAWDLETGSTSVVVAILDNGVQPDHPDLDVVTPGFDMTSFAFLGFNGAPIFINDNHGTAVAGCAAATMNNGIGTVGVAPGCRVISVKIAYDDDPNQAGWTTANDWVFNGVITAAANAQITNSSFFMGSSALVTTAYDVSYNGGTMHFASTGNGGADGIGDPTIDFPASVGSTNAIGAITPTGVLTDFSNWGVGIHFVAPGTSIWSTDRTGADGYGAGSYTWFGGTSAASPYAAGVAALAMSANPNLTPVTTGSTMAATVKDLGSAGYDTFYGFGLPDAHGVVVLAMFGDDCPGGGSCAQSNGTPGCDNASCCFAICDQDPFCCQTQWDGLCAGAAAVLCFGCGGAGAGDCHSSNGSPACNNEVCCTAVCASDPFCCETSWDALCANLAGDLCGPPNDDCPSAGFFTAGTYPFDTTNATTDGPAHDSCSNAGDDQIHKDIWFKYTATCTGQLAVSTCNSANFDTRLAVYREGVVIPTTCPGTLGAGAIIGCNDDWTDCGGFTSYLAVNVTEGTDYAIRLGGYDGASGSGTVTFECTVPNDECADGITVTPGVYDFDNSSATTSGPNHDSCGAPPFENNVWNDLWYRYTAPVAGSLTVSLCGLADFDTKLAIYEEGFLGGVCPNGLFGGLLQGCADDDCGNQSELTIEVEAGLQYAIRIGNGFFSEGGPGAFEVTFSGAPGCEGDVTGDDTVDVQDLVAIILAWGPCAGGCPADITGDGVVNVEDLVGAIVNWGGCP